MDREAEITKRIELLKRKNELLMQRHKEIEEDRKRAEKSGRSVNARLPSSSDEPARNTGKNESMTKHSRAHMDELLEQDTHRQPLTQHPRERGAPNVNRRSERERGDGPERGRGDPGRGRGDPGRGRGGPERGIGGPERGRGGPERGRVGPERGRGRGGGPERGRGGPGRGRVGPERGMGDPERGRGGAERGRGRGSERGRGRGSHADYDLRRMENFRQMEEELAQKQAEEASSDATLGGTRFLDDPRRRGELNPEDRWKSTRHKGNYGGLEFDNVKQGIRGHYRGNYRGGRGRGNSKLQMELTGKERQDQERWHTMREAADKEIMARSKNTEGNWRREWDCEKHPEFEEARYERHDQQRRGNYLSNGRGRRGSRGDRGTGRRGGRGGREHEEQRKENGNAEEFVPPISPAEKDSSLDIQVDVDAPPHVQEHETKPSESAQAEVQKPQRQRKKQNKNERKIRSPRHQAVQRAQTPSSKDGTEVWAQNSHHSDETGAKWKNGANQSTEQWLPSDEGNRNPAIDERMLEQQEGGATVYTRQLGRGWGDEKNIKATKAWVIDTEKAGATEKVPELTHTENARGRNETRNVSKSSEQEKPKDVRTEASRLRDDVADKTRLRSASPRVKRDNPGLTVEIRHGGTRRVKHHSEGDHMHIGQSDKSEGGPKQELETVSSPTRSPLSPGPMKTPEGMDWAAEMDMLSPTYAKRHLQLQEVDSTKEPTSGSEAVVHPDPEEGRVLDSTSADTATSGLKETEQDSSNAEKNHEKTEESGVNETVENAESSLQSNDVSPATSDLKATELDLSNAEKNQDKREESGVNETVENTESSLQSNDVSPATADLKATELDSSNAEKNQEKTEESGVNETVENTESSLQSIDVSPATTDVKATEVDSSNTEKNLEKTKESEIKETIENTESSLQTNDVCPAASDVEETELDSSNTEKSQEKTEESEINETVENIEYSLQSDDVSPATLEVKATEQDLSNAEKDEEKSEESENDETVENTGSSSHPIDEPLECAEDDNFAEAELVDSLPSSDNVQETLPTSYSEEEQNVNAENIIVDDINNDSTQPDSDTTNSKSVALDTSNEDATDSNFKDAKDLEDDDEFYECEDDKNEQDDTSEAQLPSQTENDTESERIEPVEDKKDSTELSVAAEDDAPKPASCTAAENIQTVVTETVVPRVKMSHDNEEDGSENISTTDSNSVNEPVADSPTGTETSVTEVANTSQSQDITTQGDK